MHLHTNDYRRVYWANFSYNRLSNRVQHVVIKFRITHVKYGVPNPYKPICKSDLPTIRFSSKVFVRCKRFHNLYTVVISDRRLQIIIVRNVCGKSLETYGLIVENLWKPLKIVDLTCVQFETWSSSEIGLQIIETLQRLSLILTFTKIHWAFSIVLQFIWCLRTT